jgi:hypothetical protein
MIDEELEIIGYEVVDLLKTRSFEKIGSKYGYALRSDCSAEEAIEEDLEIAITECSGNIELAKAKVTISHFKPNETGLKSLIECSLPLGTSVGVLVELILNESGSVYLEQISSYGDTLNA